MKEKLINLFSQTSTWRHLMMASGGLLTYIAEKINPQLLTISIPIFLFFVGLIGILTEDYKDTPNKVDDIIHAAAEGITGGKDGN